MKTYKKIRLGLIFTFAAVGLITSLTLLTGTHKALAAGTFTLGSDFQFTDQNHITGSITPNGTASNPITFYDKSSTPSTNTNYAPQGLDGTLYCSSDISNWGINLTQPVDFSASSISGTITIGNVSGQNCDPETMPITISNPGQVATAQYAYDSNGNIDSTVGSETLDSQNGAPNVYIGGNANGEGSYQCGATYVIVADASNPDQGTLYTLGSFTATAQALFEANSVLTQYVKSSGPGCGIQSEAQILIAGTSSSSGGTTACTTGSTSSSCTPAGSTSDADECAAEANSTMSWIMCPILTAVNGALFGTNGNGGLVGVFLSTLSFRVSDLAGSSNGQANVEKTWALIRDVSSAAVVIIMLIMILSQAIGGGPFDAYTVRKLLPKLAAAVILMQLSWVLVAWVINTFDDFGKGIADLLYYPFGGPNNLSLQALLSHANLGQGGSIALDAASWLAIPAILIMGVAALPVLLVLVLSAVVGIGVVIVTLVFRQILLVTLLIFSPLAILAWILPGTQTYYKMWKDNLLKALMMFPIAVSIIAVGRIFAYIVGTQSESLFLNIVFVFVGYFGVLFILPKTFKWGGTMMTAGTTAISGLGSKGTGALKEPLKGIGERWQGAQAKKYDPTTKGFKGWTGRGIRRIESGHIIPKSERSRRLTIAAGDKWANERNEEADALVKRTQEKALNGYEVYDIKDGKYGEFSRRRDAAGNLLDAAGNVTDAKDAAFLDAAGNVTDQEHAAFTARNKKNAFRQEFTGVQAGKQALLDIAGNDGNSEVAKRAAQSAIKQLIDTHSEIELQGSRIQGGKNSGRRASEVKLWNTTITNSPQHYSAINNSRPDLAPDLIESAQGKAGYTYDEAYAETNTATRETKLRALDKARLSIALDRMTPEALQSAHYGLFQDIARTQDKGLADQFAGVLNKFNNSGSTLGVNAVGSLRGGKEQHVEAALSAGYPGATTGGGAGPVYRRTIDNVI